jgi:hypothetical protein
MVRRCTKETKGILTLRMERMLGMLTSGASWLKEAKEAIKRSSLSEPILDRCPVEGVREARVLTEVLNQPELPDCGNAENNEDDKNRTS